MLSKCTQYTTIVHIDHKYGLYALWLCTGYIWGAKTLSKCTQLHSNAFGCIWRASMLSKYTQYATIVHINHKYGPYALWLRTRYIWRAKTLSKCTQLHSNAFGCIWTVYMLSKCTQCTTIAHTDHICGPYML